MPKASRTSSQRVALLACGLCVALPRVARAEMSLVTDVTLGAAFDPARSIRSSRDVAFQYGAHARALFGPVGKEHQATFRVGPFAEYAAVADARQSYSLGVSSLVFGSERGAWTLGQILPLTASAGVSLLRVNGEPVRFGPRLRLDWGVSLPMANDAPLGPLVALFVDAGYFPDQSRGSRADIGVGLAIDPIALAVAALEIFSDPPDFSDLGRFR